MNLQSLSSTNTGPTGHNVNIGGRKNKRSTRSNYHIHHTRRTQQQLLEYISFLCPAILPGSCGESKTNRGGAGYIDGALTVLSKRRKHCGNKQQQHNLRNKPQTPPTESNVSHGSSNQEQPPGCTSQKCH